MNICIDGLFLTQPQETNQVMADFIYIYIYIYIYFLFKCNWSVKKNQMTGIYFYLDSKCKFYLNIFMHLISMADILTNNFGWPPLFTFILHIHIKYLFQWCNIRKHFLVLCLIFLSAIFCFLEFHFFSHFLNFKIF